LIRRNTDAGNDNAAATAENRHVGQVNEAYRHHNAIGTADPGASHRIDVARMPATSTGPRSAPRLNHVDVELVEKNATAGAYGVARTVRSRIPRVAFSAVSGMIGHAPVAFQFSPTFDQS
jgi:hypothetical protein